MKGKCLERVFQKNSAAFVAESVCGCAACGRGHPRQYEVGVGPVCQQLLAEAMSNMFLSKLKISIILYDVLGENERGLTSYMLLQ